jgi:hypothetical protein
MSIEKDRPEPELSPEEQRYLLQLDRVNQEINVLEAVAPPGHGFLFYFALPSGGGGGTCHLASALVDAERHVEQWLERMRRWKVESASASGSSEKGNA